MREFVGGPLHNQAFAVSEWMMGIVSPMAVEHRKDATKPEWMVYRMRGGVMRFVGVFLSFEKAFSAELIA